ncbi:MAG TPA: ATP-binding cassette domain-containing protein, partial [Acidimicrobiia bacterium]|nr:ATP-binding cassette domain-containing protein [Acidimicrobiia bacterium]
MHAVEAHGLVKRFGSTQALCGVDLTVERATVLGVLGPNGAGKTTAVRILTTLLKPDAGSAFIDGIDVVREPRRARARIGLTGQYAAVDERLTGYENLEHVARLFHQRGPEARRRASELIERFDLAFAARRVVKTYSGGMRRRLDIAMSLVGRPSVLFLDEPTTGLDPRSRNTMWDLIDELVRSGMTTLLTTQYLEEADRLADEIAVIDHGTVIERGTAAELKRRVGGDQIEVVVTDPATVHDAIARLAEFSVGEAHVDGDGRHVLV